MKFKKSIAAFIAGVMMICSSYLPNNLSIFGIKVSAENYDIHTEYEKFKTIWLSQRERLLKAQYQRENPGVSIEEFIYWFGRPISQTDYAFLKSKYSLLDSDFLDKYSDYVNKWWEDMSKAYQPIFDDRKNSKEKAEWQSYMAEIDTIEEYISMFHSPMSLEEFIIEKLAFPEGALVSEGEVIDYGDVSDQQYLSPNDGMIHIGCNPYVETRIKQVLDKDVYIGDYKDKTKFIKVDVPERGDSLITDGHYVFVEDVGKTPDGDYIVYTSDGNCAFRQDGFVTRRLKSQILKELKSVNGAFYRIVEKDLTKALVNDRSVYTEKGDINLTVKYGKNRLIEGRDYTVSIKNKNISIGKTVTATITGINYYAGKFTKDIHIVPDKTSYFYDGVYKDYNFIDFYWIEVLGAEKYQIQYSVDNGKSYKVLCNTSGKKEGNWLTYRTTKLNTNKKYIFRIRAYKKINSKIWYGGYTYIK